MPLVVPCPHCKVEARWVGNSYRPFCSERCRLIDLGSWAEERYCIVGNKLEDESSLEDKNPNDIPN